MAFSQLLQYLTQRPSFSTHRAALMTIIDLIFPAFSLKFVDFAANSAFAASFHSTRRDARAASARFNSGVIFMDQSQFLSAKQTSQVHL